METLEETLAYIIDPTRYVLFDDLLKDWKLYYNISDDTYCSDIQRATFFKKECLAKLIAEKTNTKILKVEKHYWRE